MNTRALFVKFATVAAVMVGLAQTVAAETRVFTDNTGRTTRGELVTVNGDFVTIKREADGQNFTVKASNFSKPDMEYFAAHGLKATDAAARPATPTAPVGTPASTAPMRINVKVYSAKQESNSKSYYDKDQRLSYKIEVRNGENKRDLEKAKGTLMVFAKVLRYNDQTEVVAREDFTFDVRAQGMYMYEMQKAVRLRYYAETSYGLRGSGYLVVLKDSTGKTVNVTGSSDTVAKNYEAALKLKLYDIFVKDYKFLQEGSTSYINIR